MFHLATTELTHFLAVVGMAGEAHLWLALFQQPRVTTLYTYRWLSDIVSSVAWSPDGKCIASRSNDKTVQAWQAM